MTLQDLIEKLRRFPVPSICGAIVFVCFFAFYLRMNLLSELEIENDEIQLQLQQVEQNIAHGKTLEEHITSMKEKMAELDSRLIKHADLAINNKYFYELEVATHVTMGDLRQTVSAPVKGAPATILKGIDYAVLITGRFDQIVAYLNELEHGRHFFRLKSINIQRGREEGTTIKTTPVSMSLNLELLGSP